MSQKPEKRKHKDWCLTGNVGDNTIITNRETSCICGKFYQDKLIDQYEAWLKGKETVTPREVEAWVQENGPQVKVESYGMEGTSKVEEEGHAAVHQLEGQGITFDRDMSGELQVYRRGEMLDDAEMSALPEATQN